MIAAGGTLLALLSVLGSCTLISDLSGDQCETDADCSGRGEAFASTICSPQKICVPPGSLGCSSNQDCIDQNGGLPFICKNPGVGEDCTPLLKKDLCFNVVGDVSDDNVLILGFMFPGSGDLAFLSNDLTIPPMELALKEFAETGNGLPIGPNGTRRPLAVVACDELVDPTGAADYLINTIGVPAILGPGTAGQTIQIGQDEAFANNVLMFPPGHCATIEEEVQDGSLLWSVYPDGRTQADAMVKLVGKYEDRVRTEQGLSPDPAVDQIRVAMTVRGDAETQGLANYLQTVLMFNGKTALANSADDCSPTGPCFLRRDYPDPDFNPDPSIFDGVTADLLAFDPQIIIPVGLVETATPLLESIEANWTDPTFRPLYGFLDGGFNPDPLSVAIVADLALPTPTGLASRLAGTVPYGDYGGDSWAAFNIRYNGLFGKDAIPIQEFWYDAIYLAAYAAVGAGQVPTLDGKALANGLLKVGNQQSPGSGTPINAGPTDINKAFAALSVGGEIDYQGVVSPYDFDQSTGCAKSDYTVWCFSVDASNMPVLDASGSYAFYDYKQDTLTGTFTCPSL